MRPLLASKSMGGGGENHDRWRGGRFLIVRNLNAFLTAIGHNAADRLLPSDAAAKRLGIAEAREKMENSSALDVTEAPKQRKGPMSLVRTRNAKNLVGDGVGNSSTGELARGFSQTITVYVTHVFGAAGCIVRQ